MLTVGADPEVFVKHGGQFISGHTFPCGTKAEPTKTKHGAVQVDGLALEFNVRPAKTEIQFLRHVKSVYADLERIIRETNPECSLHAQATVVFGREYISSLPEEYQRLGCNPDYNAYTLEENPPPDGSADFRTGAGHVHLGYRRGGITFREDAALVRELDYYLGLPSLGWDTDVQRRTLYGQAGAFRPKEYGLEYRTLSNVWLNDDELIRFVFAQTKKCYEHFREGRSLYDKYGLYAQEAINSSAGKLRADVRHDVFGA